MAKQTKAAPAGTVAARHALQAQQEAAVNDERARIAAETAASRKATTKRLDAKPTDTRGL